MNRLQRNIGIAVLALAAVVTAAFAQSSTPVQTGVFHGQVHSTSGRASIYQGSDGKLTLRLTNFKTSNGPDVHVLLIAASDAQDNDNFLKNNVERVELGKLKGRCARVLHGHRRFGFQDSSAQPAFRRHGT